MKTLRSNLSQLTDTEATELGLKQYSEENGDFTVTGTNWTTSTSALIPYKMINGTWRLRFNIIGNISPKKLTNFVGTISGVTTSASDEQAISVHLLEVSVANRPVSISIVQANSGTFQVDSDGNVDYDRIHVSGDIALAEKPTWAN